MAIEHAPEAAGMDKKPPRVLVSILNYNDFDNAVETITCFLQQTDATFDLQLIDNASTDGSVAQLRARFPSLRIVENRQNFGYVGGNNIALEMALAGGYVGVVIANPDIAVEPDLLCRLMQSAAAHPKAGVVGGIEESYATGAIKAAGGVGFNRWLAKPKWLTRTGDDAISAVDYVQGACLLVTRAALVAGLRFDQSLFMYLDEVDLGLLLKRLNLSAIVDTHCRIRHKARPAPFNLLTGYLIQRNRLYLARKHGSTVTFAFSLFYMAILELPLKCIIRTLQGHGDFCRACLLGFIDGVQGRMGSGRALTLAAAPRRDR